MAEAILRCKESGTTVSAKCHSETSSSLYSDPKELEEVQVERLDPRDFEAGQGVCATKGAVGGARDDIVAGHVTILEEHRERRGGDDGGRVEGGDLVRLEDLIRVGRLDWQLVDLVTDVIDLSR